METLQPKLRFPEFNGDLLNKKIGEVADLTTGNKDTQNKVDDGEYPFYVRSQTIERINSFSYDGEAILTSGDGVGVGKNFHYINGKFDFHQRVYCIHKFKENINGKFVFQYFSEKFLKRITRMNAKNSVDSVRREMIFDMPIFIPSLPEQTLIANFLSAVDEKLNLLKEKKALLEEYKKGIMQKVFNQEIRFKDDNGNDFEDWEVKTIGESCNCLDSQRKPLNGQERQLIQGDYPYWGANNIMDYIDNYIFDETIVLLAEDGGNFNEFKTRPIANLSKGKCWVNNHTHVLKGKENIIINEFLFYSLVHRDITGFVSGGTRSKLIKSEMLKIPIDLPSIEEQIKISNFLSAIDEKIELVSNQIQDTQEYKKGLLQQMFV